MVTIRHERTTDLAAREALLDRCLGQARTATTSERLRERRLPAEGLAFVATEHGRVVGTVRLWHVSTGRARPALLLGPLAVDADCRNRGVGAALMKRAITEARQRGHREIFLVGDAPYYVRFGFSAAHTGKLALPGPFERHRLLGLALTPDAAAEPAGLLRATGAAEPDFAVAEMVAIGRKQAGKRSRLSHAA
jgi:predicted N-acetyltransferase YhbS